MTRTELNEDEFREALTGVLDDWFKRTPRALEYLRQAREAMERAYPVLCPFGRCEHLVDPLDNTIVSTVGLSGCPCDHKSKYYDGLPKPRWHTKARGKHGSKVSGSKRRENNRQRSFREIQEILNG